MYIFRISCSVADFLLANPWAFCRQLLGKPTGWFVLTFGELENHHVKNGKTSCVSSISSNLPIAICSITRDYNTGYVRLLMSIDDFRARVYVHWIMRHTLNLHNIHLRVDFHIFQGVGQPPTRAFWLDGAWGDSCSVGVWKPCSPKIISLKVPIRNVDHHHGDLRYFFLGYPSVNSHSYGKFAIYSWFTYSNSDFPIATVGGCEILHHLWWLKPYK